MRCTAITPAIVATATAH